MPSHILHSLAGLDALSLSGISVQPDLQPFFLLGCQGPDIFAHSRRTKPLALAYARLLHRRLYGAFCAQVCEFCVDLSHPYLTAWLYGFATHQCMDRFLHPYIVHRSHVVTRSQGEPSPARMHAFFERILDSAYLQLIKKTPVREFDTDKRFFIDDAHIHALSSCIAASLSRTYGEDAGDRIEERVSNAFHDALSFYRYTNPAAPLFTRAAQYGKEGLTLVFPENINEGVDWLNLSRTAWKHPVTGQSRTESVPDLYAMAVSQAVGVLGKVKDCIDGNAPFSDVAEAVGNESLAANGEDGLAGAVRFSEPFDLEAELERQFTLRVDPASACLL